jgi:hypothetical protein
VTPATARVLQSQLERYQASSPHKPYFDFHHDEKEASAWPKAFTWQEDRKSVV